ncbi:MAG: hypothetical protein KatS3mg124_0701 [Porticoccaceae bacterium]|nr:MAG: hypothetical protein KatS3mg124_0701 [Porticoccaceae bacterium]
MGALRCRRRWRFGAVGAGVLAASLTLTPPLTYGLVTAAAERLGLDLTGARPLPYRDNNRYFFFPPKNGDRGARRLATELLAAMPPGAVLIADYTLWRPLLFLQRVERVRPDVEVVFAERLWGEGVDRWIARQGPARRVFLATDRPPAYYQLERVRARFGLRRWGWAVELVGC